MKTIKLKAINIQNFMGCKEFRAEFEDRTIIHGDNRLGKSTIYDAFLWLLFGKNHEGKKDFYIKNTVDTSLNRQDHVVTGVFDIDGEEMVLTRVYKEKHQKKRGSDSTEFSGHETEYFWNDVPLKEKEYSEKVAAVVPESIFKMLTNIYAFNELPWQDRRKILNDIAGEKTDVEIAGSDPDFIALLAKIKNKSLDEYRKQLVSQKNKTKERLDQVPALISEASRAIQDVSVLYDDEMLKKYDAQISELNQEKKNITEANKAKLEAINTRQNRLASLKRELSDLQRKRKEADERAGSDAKDRLRKTESEKQSAERELASIKNNIEEERVRHSNKDSELSDLRTMWLAINEERAPDMSDSETSCPSCGQQLPEDKLENKKEAITAAFNENKTKRLDAINKEGSTMKGALAAIAKNIQLLTEKLDAKQKEIKKLEDALADATKSAEDVSDIKETPPSKEEVALQAEIDVFVIEDAPTIDFGDIDDRIKKINEDRDKCVSAKTTIAANQRQKDRIKELEAEEKSLAQEIAKNEKEEFVIANFIKKKMEEIEKNVTSKFKYCQVQMFEQLINGGEQECCIIKHGGVPYSSVNTAGKINMGIDIINTLIDHYQMAAPVFIDNAEATNEISECNAQLIQLKVSDAKKLTVFHQ